MYIVTGFAFLQTLHFAALKQNTKNIENLLTGSLVIGYVYNIVANLIPFSCTKETDNILIIISAVVSAYCIGRFSRTEYALKILNFLKIRDTGNLYFWDDLMDNDYPMKAVIIYDDYVYEGMVHLYESYSNNPHIVLAAYQIKNSDGTLKKDYSDDMTKIIILDISYAKNVTIIYYANSPLCIDLKNLCDFNKEFERQENS